MIFEKSKLVKLDVMLSGDVVILTVYVKEGSMADTEFDNYNDGQMIKEFY